MNKCDTVTDVTELSYYHTVDTHTFSGNKIVSQASQRHKPCLNSPSLTSYTPPYYGIIKSVNYDIKKLHQSQYITHAYRHKQAFDQNPEYSVLLNFTHENKIHGTEQASLSTKRYQKNESDPEFERTITNPVEIASFEVKP